VALVRVYVSEERITTIIRATRIGVLGTTVAVTINIVFLRKVFRLLIVVNIVPRSLILINLIMEAIRSSETSVLARSTRLNFPEDVIVL
jgi:hypothetical protein